ncbi:aldo/keto reductase [Alphaproteobacteria bacterium]|nr:aldo/keto reductase [Alphaproteobacteria bacterium]
MDRSKFAIGTAQFGSDYGISNVSGKVNYTEARAILELAGKHGITTLDTAINYGESESVIGNIGCKSWKIITKIPNIPCNCNSFSEWISSTVKKSIDRLKIDKIYGVLLHHPNQLLSSNGRAIYQSLSFLKERGYVEKIGISIYNPDQLSKLRKRYDFDIVQCPMNIFDTRMLDSGWLDKLSKDNTEVHVRSIFLQGLLLMRPEVRPSSFAFYRKLWMSWDNWLESNNLSALEACVNWILGITEVNKVIVGVQSTEQLNQILNISNERLPKMPVWSDFLDYRLIDPTNWNVK